MTISFDRAVDFYDNTRGLPEGVSEQIRDALVNYTGANKTSRFLELGVGTGRIAVPFIQAGYDYTGIDISTAMMARLNQKLTQDQAFSSYRYQLQQADVTELPFPDDSFDIIITVAVIHLLDGWQKALQEAKRVLLKPNGTLVISDRLRSVDSEESSPLRITQKKWGEIHAELKKGAEYKRREGWVPEEEIVAYLEELGAEVQTVTLVKYTNPELSVREAVARIKARYYSADWDIPEEIHQEAVRRLEKWLEEEYPEPDRKISLPGEFSVLIAKWSE